MAVAEARKTRILTLELPDELYALYAEKAEKSGKTPESLIVSRLADCRDHDSARPLYFPDRERGELEKILGGHMFSDAAQAITKLKSYFSVRVTSPSEPPVEIFLSPLLLMRLKSRLFRRKWHDMIREEVTKALERFVEMR